MKRLFERVITVIGVSVIAIGVCYSCYSYLTKNSSLRKGGQRKEKIRIACIGDSITYGSGVRATRKIDSYPAKLGRLLGKEYAVRNYGVGGRTLQDEGDYPYRAEKVFLRSQNFLPDIVLIMLGTNDSKPFNWNADEYRKQLQEFVEIYRSLPGRPQVYLMTCCAAFCMNGKAEVVYQINGTIIANEVRDSVIQVAQENKIPVIDIYDITKEHPEYFMDGVHPNVAGNQVIAQTVFDVLKEKNSP